MFRRAETVERAFVVRVINPMLWQRLTVVFVSAKIMKPHVVRSRFRRTNAGDLYWK